jgi:hypothetical protein
MSTRKNHKKNEAPRPKGRGIISLEIKNSDIIAFFALVVSVISLIVSGIGAYAAKKNTDYTSIEMVLGIIKTLENYTTIVNDLTIEYNKLLIKNSNADEPDQTELINMEIKINAAITNLLNIYEYTCSQYLSTKIETVAFESFFKYLILDLSETYKSHLENPEYYESIHEVIKRWN